MHVPVFCVFGGVIFTMDSIFYLLVGLYPELPRKLNIPSWFVQRTTLEITLKPIVFNIL